MEAVYYIKDYAEIEDDYWLCTRTTFCTKSA
jgi:hypothetical protein